MKPPPKPVQVPAERRAYGRVVYALAYTACLICLLGPLVALAFPEATVMRPHATFEAVLAGHSISEVWQAATGGFPGAHFYRHAWTAGDGITMFGLAAVGCTASAWGLIAAAFRYYRRRSWGYAVTALGIAALVFLSALAF